MAKKTLSSPLERDIRTRLGIPFRSLEPLRRDPSSGEASENLRRAFTLIDRTRNPKKQAANARLLAENIIRTFEDADEGRKEEATRVIAEQLKSPSATRTAISDLIAEHRRMRGNAAGDGRRSETESFEFHLERLIRDNPRFAGLGEVMLEIGDGKEVRVKKADPLLQFQPWWIRRWRQLAAVSAGIALAASLAAMTHSYGSLQADYLHAQERAERREPGPASDAAPQEERGPENRITPDDVAVLRAVDAAVRRKDTPFNIAQIMDVYNFVVENIRYLNVSDPVVPRWPSETLEANWGDCKSMSVLLASMLEAIGAKTLLFSWHDRAARTGHQYVGVMVSDSQDPAERQEARRAITRLIRRAYGRTINRHYGGRMPQVQFRELNVGGRNQLHLLLDATAGRNSVAGVGNPRPDIERIEESRPGHRGRAPEMR